MLVIMAQQYELRNKKKKATNTGYADSSHKVVASHTLTGLEQKDVIDNTIYMVLNKNSNGT
jgi:hypothetical protein